MTKDIKRTALQLPIRNNLLHLYSAEKGKASKKWLQNFFAKTSNIGIKETSTYI
jgi:hypothetical protein